jgi:NodT family efflux transporter outer membrane factor (OMF) lipoprotein
MTQTLRPKFAAATVLAFLVLSLCGCTSFRDYFHNGLKVGPNYCRPKVPVADQWIDAAKIPQTGNIETLSHWWTVFNDPKLNEMIECAHRQNLTLREAGCRVLQARATLAIARGDFFPQGQNLSGSYTRSEASLNPPVGGGGGSRFSNAWNLGFNLQWELDFWGQFRRAIASADASLNASVEGYDAVLVTLLGDIAKNYVLVRTDQERIRLLQYNVEHVQMGVWQRAMLRSGRDPKTGQLRPGAGGTTVIESEADVAESTLKQTQASITQLNIAEREAENQLCILMGMPPVDLRNYLNGGPIPRAPADVAFGIPADLVRRRPDVRQAERQAAAQAEQIGISQAGLYPAIYINGTLGYQAAAFPNLFTNEAFRGSVGPSFQWNVLNYGRIVNSVRYQDATFQLLVATYQQTALDAAAEVENALVSYVQSQDRAKYLYEAMQAQAKAVNVARTRYFVGQGEASFTTYTLYEQNLLNAQDASAQAQGEIAQSLISVYRALGGGWEIRLDNNNQQPAQGMPAAAPGGPNGVEPVPSPAPAPPSAPQQPADLQQPSALQAPDFSRGYATETPPEPTAVQFQAPAGAGFGQ